MDHVCDFLKCVPQRGGAASHPVVARRRGLVLAPLDRRQPDGALEVHATIADAARAGVAAQVHAVLRMRVAHAELAHLERHPSAAHQPPKPQTTKTPPPTHSTHIPHPSSCDGEAHPALPTWHGDRK